jgi:hypothetical protein
LQTLGKLRVLDIRSVWPLEPQHFSKWLADDIQQLGLAVGLDLEVRGREVTIGSFSLDILAHDTANDRKVIIENQLTRTDHDHLGKLMTYASGVGASVVIWIAPDFRDEHRAALDWLNVNTSDAVQFFGIKIEALQIDDSKPAPNFKVVAFPNEWQRATAATARNTEVSESGAFFTQFFESFGRRARAAGVTDVQQARPQSSLFCDRIYKTIQLAVAFSREAFTCGLYIALRDVNHNRVVFEELQKQRTAIEHELGMELKWDFHPDRIRQQIWTSISPIDRSSAEDLDRAQQWGIETLMKFKKVFSPRVQAIVSRLGSQLDGLTPIEGQ